MSTISIDVEDIGDIHSSVLYAQTRFQTQMGGAPGTATVVVKDPDQIYDFITGKKLVVTLDGVPLWGGYISQVQRGFAFPVVDTSTPSTVKARQWTLQCVDYNILFDKRVYRDPGNYLKTPGPWDAPSYKMGPWLKDVYLAHYLDVPDGLDITTFVDDVGWLERNPDGGAPAAGTKFTAIQQGTYWRELMTELAKWGALYYIDPGFHLHLHAVESTLMPWGFSDKPNELPLPSEALATYGMRECTQTDDGGGLVNDAFVWGGGLWAGTDGGTVFARSTDSASIIDHNLWQWPENHMGEDGYGIYNEVWVRADLIVNGMPGTSFGTARGMKNVQPQYECTWFAHDVPLSGGTRQHVVPGYVMPMVLYSFGVDGDPLIVNLPLRSLSFSFPSLDPGGNPYVKFTGQFGLQLADPGWLWAFIMGLRTTQQVTSAAVSFTNNDSSSASAGSYGSFTFTPTEGQTVFVMPFTYILGSTLCYLNGLLQRLGTDYAETDTSTVTFSEGLHTTDDLVIECRTT
jgi:hypothetical protein